MSNLTFFQSLIQIATSSMNPTDKKEQWIKSNEIYNKKLCEFQNHSLKYQTITILTFSVDRDKINI